MSVSAKIREQLISSFRAELTEHVQTMSDGLLALEQSCVAGQRTELGEEQWQAILETVFRATHSLKGAARAVNVTTIEQLAHSLEGVLEAMQQKTIPLTPELFTTCYSSLDAIQAVQTAYETGETTPPQEALAALINLEALHTHPSDTVKTTKSDKAVAAPTDPSAQAVATELAHTVNLDAGSDKTIRVSVNKLDALMAQLSELLVTKIHIEQRLAQFHQAQEFMIQWQREWAAVREAYGRLSHQKTMDSNGNKLSRDLSQVLRYVNISQERLREMNDWISDLSHQYANDTTQISRAIDSLEQEIKRVRLQPLSTITNPLRRMVRDLAQKADKEASLQIVGGETELDKQVLEQLKDPLIHLLRNAIDHGIEPPEQRAASGKPRRGSISLTAEQLGQNVVIGVADDGAGLDLKAIRQAAVQQGQANASSLTEAELVELIFSLGISTSPIPTNISGRGVGLTIVRRNVEILHGHVTVDWTPGVGTTFTLTLPLILTNV